MDRTTSEIDSVDNYHQNFRKVLENIHKEMLVECKKEDVKYLNQEYYDSEEKRKYDKGRCNKYCGNNGGIWPEGSAIDP